MNGRKLIWILWPSFIVAGIAEGLFFTVFDPRELVVFGETLEWSRTAIYSTGFFVFWAITALSSALTCFLQKSPAEVNKCPLEPQARPPGCPRRDGTDEGCSG